MREADFDRVVLRFMEAAGVPALWPDALDELATAAGASGAIIHLVVPDQETRSVWSEGVAEHQESFVAGGWHNSNSRMERSMALVQRGWRGIITEQDTFTQEELAGDPFHQDWSYPRGYVSYAGAIIASAPGMFLPLTIERWDRQEPFSRPETVLLNRLIPYVQAAGALSMRIADSGATGMIDTFSRLGQAAALIGRDGRAFATNQQFERHIGDGVRLVRGRPQAQKPDADAALASALARAIRFESPRDEPLLPVILPRRGSRRPLLAEITPVVATAGDFFRSASAILILIDLDLGAKPAPVSILRQVFGLTPAEGRLAARLGAGDTLEAAAAAECVTRETARSRIKAIFAKTDTHRQSELIALLARLPEGSRSEVDKYLLQAAYER